MIIWTMADWSLSTFSFLLILRATFFKNMLKDIVLAAVKIDNKMEENPPILDRMSESEVNFASFIWISAAFSRPLAHSGLPEDMS